MVGFGRGIFEEHLLFWEGRRGGVTSAAHLSLAPQGQGAAGRCEAPRGRDVRGAYDLSAQALGTAGLRGEAPRGSKSESTFV